MKLNVNTHQTLRIDEGQWHQLVNETDKPVKHWMIVCLVSVIEEIKSIGYVRSCGLAFAHYNQVQD